MDDCERYMWLVQNITPVESFRNINLFAGFAAFFAIFDMTLKLAKEVTAVADESAAAWNLDTRATTIKSAPGAMVHHFPRTMHAVTLVTGGVCAGLAYEYICRPWSEFSYKDRNSNV